MAKLKAKAASLLEVTVSMKYRGEKSKKGTFFPYQLEDNSYGIVGTLYIPVDKEIPHRIIVEVPAKLALLKS